IAVVIDDLGLDKRRTERVAGLKAPLTLAFMTYAEDLDHQADNAHAHGHELMVHMPMQPMDGAINAGSDALTVDLSSEELRRRIGWGLSRFKGFVGVNNHMGSRFTADTAGMRVVMEELSRRGLMFLDSVTTEKSVADEAARRFHVPFAARQIFLDNQSTAASVRGQLEKTEALARRHGFAIAIGHPRDATIEALASWLPSLEHRGFVLVPVTTVVKAAAAAPRG
ncbi:MAG: divergent polysaccharide deacetylase family protein, partial [Alphaproteobacteria bacterium]|nr:divergent polysaccharide deacetylase family protein [Alphaproteobacteria bacterium]